MRAWITAEPIDPAEVLCAVGSASDGATVAFLGHVRDHNDGRPVTGLRYEAYREMAERVLAEIAGEAEARLGGGAVAIVHRIGELAVGDVSVAIAVSSPHRADAFEVCRGLIEAVKQRLPVWKQEHYADGPEEWLPGEVPGGPVEGAHE